MGNRVRENVLLTPGSRRRRSRGRVCTALTLVFAVCLFSGRTYLERRAVASRDRGRFLRVQEGLEDVQDSATETETSSDSKLSPIEVCIRTLTTFTDTQQRSVNCFAPFQDAKALELQRLNDFQRAMNSSVECASYLVPGVLESNSTSKLGLDTQAGADQERRLLTALTQLQSVLKKSMFCVDVVRMLAKPSEGETLRLFLDRSEFLVLGSISRGEAVAFSDVDMALIVAPDDDHDANATLEGKEQKKEKVYQFFRRVKKTAALAESDRRERHFCYKANIGNFLSPVSRYFVGNPSELANIHGTLNSHTEEGFASLVEMLAHAKPRHIAGVPNDELVHIVSRRMLVILTNMYHVAPWSAKAGSQVEAYRSILRENWNGLESAINVRGQWLQIPLRYFLILHQGIKSLGAPDYLKRELTENNVFSPKMLLMLVRVNIYGMLWSNEKEQMRELFAKDSHTLSVVDLISILEKHSLLQQSESLFYRDVWLYTQSFLLVNSINSWENCVQGAKSPLPIEGYDRIVDEKTGQFDDFRVSVTSSEVTDKLAEYLSRVKSHMKELFTRQSVQLCGFLDTDMKCSDVVSSMADHIGYRTPELESALAEL